ncbi:MAG TPA: general secretion pathway protein GspK [Gammaproteobacteria bacterium]|nr:general secretion pathway protein GspK [Gammaproteobacteria bacterium]
MKRQRGVALITAVLMVSLATVAAVAMATRQQLDLRRTGNLLHGEQAWAYVLGAESWARVILARDLSQNKTDSGQDDWATQVPAAFVEGGSVAGRVVDLQGRFNLNSLVDAQGLAVPAAIARFKRLLQVLDISETLANALVDWLDKNVDVTFPDGAEDNAYLLLNPPYRAANRPLGSVSELRLVQGFSAEVVDKLRPFVCALPTAAGAVNVNTAPAEVLRTLAANLSETDGEALLAAREQGVFDDVARFLALAPLAGKEVDTDSVSVASQWFRLVAEASVGQGYAALTSLFQRTPQATRVVRRERLLQEPVTAPVPADAAPPAGG